MKDRMTQSLSIQDNLLHEVLDNVLDDEITIRHTTLLLTDRECDEKDNVSLSLTGKYSSRQKKGEGEIPKKRLQGRKRKFESLVRSFLPSWRQTLDQTFFV